MQKAKFFMEFLRITQSYGFNTDGTIKNTYSHTGSWALDLGGKDTGIDKLYCPFDAKVIRTRESANGEMYIESTEPVLWADGTQDYAKMILIHDEAFNFSEGDIISQGTYFYDEGGMSGGKPGVFSDHVHIECGKGKWRSATQYQNAYGVYIIEDQVPAHTMLWVGADVTILYDGGYDWKIDDGGEIMPEPETYQSKWLDISYHQPTVDYAKVAKDIDGVILRIGLTYWGAYNQGKDSKFDEHYTGFKSQGTPVGCYYYSCADTVDRAEEEALYFLQLMRGKQFELPVYYDVENNERQGGLSKELLTSIVKKFCSIVESAGYYVGYYSYTAWIQSKFDYTELSKYYTLWKADYRSDYDKTIPCEVHQYTSSGSVSGIATRVDLNHCYKNFEPIIKENGLNGFAKIEYTPARLKIGFASSGDIKTIAQLIEKEDVLYTIEESSVLIGTVTVLGGYIYTDLIMDELDYNAINDKCSSLDVPCEDFDVEPEPEPTPTPDPDITELEKQIAELEKKNEDLEKEVESYLATINDIEAENEDLRNSIGEMIEIGKTTLER